MPNGSCLNIRQTNAPDYTDFLLAYVPIVNSNTIAYKLLHLQMAHLRSAVLPKWNKQSLIWSII